MPDSACVLVGPLQQLGCQMITKVFLGEEKKSAEKLEKSKGVVFSACLINPLLPLRYSARSPVTLW